MSATQTQYTAGCSDRVLYLAFELGWKEWTLSFATGVGGAPRLRKVEARNLGQVLAEISKAKTRFGLPASAVVKSCYEAGRDGFWLHRWLLTQGIANHVVDSASIEVNRRSRRAKTDRLDAVKLAEMLGRYERGETKVWKVVQVPSEMDEDQRQLHREMRQLRSERTAISNRIKGLLAGQGIDIAVSMKFAERLATLRTCLGEPLGERLRDRLLFEFARWQLAHQQLLQLERGRAKEVCTSQAPVMNSVRRLLQLRGVGIRSSWLFVMEFFGWRKIRNRRELAALAGLTPTPYQSGDSDRDQGISKAGNRRVRGTIVEVSWSWLRYQPDSALSKWYWERFGKGSKRQRRIGIVALARKLLVALWRYLEFAKLPEGALEVAWQSKIPGAQAVA